MGMFLWSGPEERIAKLARDGRTREAASAAERILQKGQATPQLLTTLARVYEMGGAPARAADLLEVLALARPADPGVLRWLARSYGSYGHSTGRADALARLVRLEPTAEAVAELLVLLRLDGRFEEEFATLDLFGESALLDPSDLERLALLLAQRDRESRAVALLRAAEDRPGGLDERRRRLLFEMLVRQGAHGEAATRAAGWLAAWGKPWLAPPLILRLARSAPDEAVGRLAEAGGTLFPETRFFLAKSLAEAGRARAALGLVAGRLDPAAGPGEAEIGGTVAVAAALGDRALLSQAIAQLRAGGDAEAQAILAESLSTTYSLADLAALWPDLSSEILLRRPLLGVSFARLTRRDELARWLAAHAEFGAVRPAEQAAWLAVVRAELGPFATFALLDRLAREGELPARLRPAYRALAAETGHPPDPVRHELASLGRVALSAR
jgi:hypothetical protein